MGPLLDLLSLKRRRSRYADVTYPTQYVNKLALNIDIDVILSTEGQQLFWSQLLWNINDNKGFNQWGSCMVWEINMGVCPRLEFDNIMFSNCLGYDFYIYGVSEFLCNSIANL